MTKFDLFKNIAMLTVVVLTVATRMPDFLGRKQANPKTKTYDDEIARLGGEVIDIRLGDNRTYMNVRAHNGDSFWVSTREVAVKAGDRISFEYCVPRNNYYSSDLKKSFDAIYVLPYLDPIERDETEIS
jgi:hypothetical protein